MVINLKFLNTPGGVVRRTPGCTVEFLGETWQAINQESLVSVSTDKELGKPAGAFQIAIKVSNRISRNPHTELALSRVNAAEQPSNTLEDISTGANYWLDMLKPMMLVRIKMRPELWDPELDAHARLVPRSLTMLGSIDTVGLEKSMTPEGPTRTVVVTGRDLGKLFTDDAHYTFMWPALVTDPSEIAKSNVLFTPQTVATVAQKNSFFNRYYVRDSTSVQMDMLVNTVGKVVDALYAKASALDVVLSNHRNLREYLPSPLVADNVRPIPFFGGDGFMQMSGSVWALFEFVVPKPWGEIFVDTVGDEARLIVRRPPWGRGTWVGQKEMLQQVENRAQLPLSESSVGIKSVLGNSRAPINNAGDSVQFTSSDSDDNTGANLNSLLGVASNSAGQVRAIQDMGGALWHHDEFEDPAGRTRVTNQPYHVITDREIISMSVSRTDREVLNLFFPFPSSAWLQGEADPMQAGVLVPPILDVDSIIRYGLRLFQTENRWWFSKDQQPTDGSAPIDFLTQLLLDSIRAYFYFRDNPTYLSGMINIMGRDEIRIGDHVLVSEFHTSAPTLFYVEGVANNWRFGGEFVTSLKVTRGQPLIPPVLPPTKVVDGPLTVIGKP